MVTHILFDLCLLKHFSPVANFGDQSVRGQDEGGGKKLSVFVHVQGIKTVHAGRGDQKIVKFCPHSC